MRVVERMVAARVLICERKGRWAVAWRRQVQQLDVSLYETSSWRDLCSELSISPASLVAVEATAANLDRIADWVFKTSRDYPAARTIVMADRKLADHEWVWREAGAVHVVFARRHLRLLASLMRRHFDRHVPGDTPDNNPDRRLPVPG